MGKRLKAGTHQHAFTFILAVPCQRIAWLPSLTFRLRYTQVLNQNRRNSRDQFGLAELGTTRVFPCETLSESGARNQQSPPGGPVPRDILSSGVVDRNFTSAIRIDFVIDVRMSIPFHIASIRCNPRSLRCEVPGI
jgi:hypothetical protein